MTNTFRTAVTATAILSLLALGACGTIQRLSGKSKDPADEFAVVKRQPLTIPPEFDLAPPEPGNPSPSDLASAPDTLRALFPGREGVVPQASLGEQALLRNIEAAPLSDVREEVDDSKTEVVQKGTLLDEIVELDEREGVDGSTVERVSSEDDGGN